MNIVVLSGRLVADPELRYTAEGNAVANFTVVVDDGYGDKKKAYYHDCTAWTHTAEYLANYAKKGMPITIQGKLIVEKWEKDGKKNKKTSIIVSDVIIPTKSTASTIDENGSRTRSNRGVSVDSDMFGQEILFDDGDIPF